MGAEKAPGEKSVSEKRKMRREEILEKIKEQGFAYMWRGIVESYESASGYSVYVSARVIDDVPHVTRYFTHRHERWGTGGEYEAEVVFLSYVPFKVEIREDTWGERRRTYSRIEEAEKKPVTDPLLKHYLEVLSRPI